MSNIPAMTISTNAMPLYLCSARILYTKYAGIMQAIKPKIGPSSVNSLSTGAFNTMAPQETATANTKMPM